MELSFGPNMRRVLEMDAQEIQVCVTAGPGDTLIWEVRSAGAPAGIRLEVVGRGPDIEAAAAALLPLLSLHGSALQPTAPASRKSDEPGVVARGSDTPGSQPSGAFETSWVEDEVSLWHRSTYPVGYIESTSPWIFTTLCVQDLHSATPPAKHAPETAAVCTECGA